MFLDYDGPTKSHKLEKGAFFDLLPMGILHNIDDWLIGIEHNKKFKTVVACIQIPRNTVLYIRAHKHWIPYLLLGNYFLYHETRYYYLDIH